MKRVDGYWIYRLGGTYPSCRWRTADGEEGRGPDGVEEEEEGAFAWQSLCIAKR
jgi:hypothetical protein